MCPEVKARLSRLDDKELDNKYAALTCIGVNKEYEVNTPNIYKKRASSIASIVYKRAVFGTKLEMLFPRHPVGTNNDYFQTPIVYQEYIRLA